MSNQDFDGLFEEEATVAEAEVVEIAEQEVEMQEVAIFTEEEPSDATEEAVDDAGGSAEEVQPKKRGRKPGSKNKTTAESQEKEKGVRATSRMEIVSELFFDEDFTNNIIKKWKFVKSDGVVSNEILKIQEEVRDKNPSEVDPEKLLKQLEKLKSRIGGDESRRKVETAISSTMAEQMPGFAYEISFEESDGKITGVRVKYSKTLRFNPS